MKTLLRIAAVLSFAVAGAFAWGGYAVAQNVTEDEAYANIVVCTDPACEGETDMGGMEGATITSYNAAGEVIDACNVETFVSGLNGCVITQHGGDGSYSAEITSEFAGYSLLSDQPEVLESESHGTQLVWYAAPPAEETAPPAEDPVEELPDVGVGVGSHSSLLAAAAFGVALLGVSATALRRYARA